MSKSMHGTVTRVSAGSLTWHPQLSVFTECNFESHLTDTLLGLDDTSLHNKKGFKRFLLKVLLGTDM